MTKTGTDKVIWVGGYNGRPVVISKTLMLGADGELVTSDFMPVFWMDPATVANDFMPTTKGVAA